MLYNLENRGIEHDLLPFCRGRGMPVMAYSPVGQGGALLRHKALRAVAARHGGATPAQVAIAWTLRAPGGVISIPKASDPEHVRQNAAARDLRLTRGRPGGTRRRLPAAEAQATPGDAMTAPRAGPTSPRGGVDVL